MANVSTMTWLIDHRDRFWLSLRITLAAVLSFALAEVLGLSNSYWAVITAIIVIQSSVGGSLKATVDRFVGTVGGSVWGIVVSLALPHQSPLLLGAALILTLAPLAVLASFQPAYRVAPITAMILLLVPLHTGGPLYSGLDRILQIGLGGGVAMLVALFVLPARAQGLVAAAAARALESMAELTSVLTADLSKPVDMKRVQDFHDRIRRAIGQAEAAAEEAGRERRSHLTTAPDAEPLCRTLRRLRNDLAAVGRATGAAFQAELWDHVAGPVARAGTILAQRLRAIAAALQTQGHVAGSQQDVEQALALYQSGIGRMRQQGVLRSLSGEAITQLFGLSFALDQLNRDLGDLADRADEWARSPGT